MHTLSPLAVQVDAREIRCSCLSPHTPRRTEVPVCASVDIDRYRRRKAERPGAHDAFKLRLLFREPS